MSRCAIVRLWIQSQETGHDRRCPGQGCPHVTTANNNQCIRLTARPNRRTNAMLILRQILLTTGQRVSSKTIQNRFHGDGLYAREPIIHIPLIARQYAGQRKWADEH